MTLKNTIPLLLGIGCLAHSAQAHLTYTGRDFGTFSGLTSASAAINNQTATSNYGWADAADGILGDSHRGRGFRFTLQNEASITLTVAANPTATGTSVGGLIPAFSIYQGLAAVSPFTSPQTSADHDSSTASVVWRNFYETQNSLALNSTAGSWNALGDWKMGGDGDVASNDDFSSLSSFTYKGSAAATGGANTISGSFTLPAGSYTIMIGGNDITTKPTESAMPTPPGYGIAATLNVASITPVPEPQTYALLAAGAAMIGLGMRHRKN